MHNKSFLSVLEQVCMILFFSLAAAVALQGFALAESISDKRDTLEYAVVAVQNAAETVKSCKGDFVRAADLLSGTGDDDSFSVSYDEKGSACSVSSPSAEKFILVTQKTDSDNPLLGCAYIQAICDDTTIFSLTVCWQEGQPYES